MFATIGNVMTESVLPGWLFTLPTLIVVKKTQGGEQEGNWDAESTSITPGHFSSPLGSEPEK